MLYECPDPAGAIVAKMPCNVYVPPADPTDPNDTSGTWLSAAPRSRHPGGVNAAFVDGSVHFVTDGIDEVTMAYLISVDDGQAVSLR
jgi:prepilin-type processing-associated H-X9-DG protein